MVYELPATPERVRAALAAVDAKAGEVAAGRRSGM
jgi:hypothetical protein